MKTLDFLWLELTTRCNLRCTHCYSESGPEAVTPDGLREDEYVRLLDEASDLSCPNVQFIGGEPTLVPFLPKLIRHAAVRGFPFIEVFTNATHIPQPLFDTLVKHRVAVATSFYCDDPAIHDRITGRTGSHKKTTETIARLLAAGLDLRAGIIVMPENQARVEATRQFLHNLGVKTVGFDRIRQIGRAGNKDDPCVITELCGRCWQNSLAITPNGTVAACIMSRAWPVGSVRSSTLADILRSNALGSFQRRVYEEVWGQVTSVEASCDPRSCSPGICWPDCIPRCSPPCVPLGCGPKRLT